LRNHTWSAHPQADAMTSDDVYFNANTMQLLPMQTAFVLVCLGGLTAVGHYYFDFSGVTMDDILYAAPTMRAQLACALLQAIVWYVMISFVYPIFFAPAIRNMPSRENFLRLTELNLKKVFLIDTGGDREILFSFAVVFQGVIAQHIVGGLLCVPSLIGGLGLSKATVTALACQGGLCETGWELQDTLVRVFQVLFGGELGQKFNPPPFLVLMLLHHTAAQCLVIPNNLEYRDNGYYHEGIFLLQGCAALAFAMQQFGYCLDIESRVGLTLMKLNVIIVCAAMWWGRFFRYGYLWYLLLSTYHADGSYVFKLALPPVVCLSLFNMLLLIDAAAKAVKFIPMSLRNSTHEELEASLAQATSVAPEAFIRKLTTPKKEWAKLRGAVAMGAFSKGKSKKL